MKTFFSTYLFKFLLFLSIYFAPVFASMAAIAVFIIVDLVSGLMVAYRSGEPITSKKLRNTIGKTTSYFLAILTSHIFELQFLPAIPIMKIVALFIASAEIKSIMENLGKITGLDFWTLIKGYLSQNKSK